MGAGARDARRAARGSLTPRSRGSLPRFFLDEWGRAAPLLAGTPLRRLTNAEQEQIAKVRSIRPEAVSLAGALRCLYYGVICGYPSWVLTDQARIIAEGRRLDGQPYPAIGSLEERKAHTLRGSKKNWPVGLATLERSPEFTGTVLLVEGGPDFLAALHFAITLDRWNVLPIAMLGRNAGAIHPRALEVLRGRKVRLYPHADEDGGGREAAQDWFEQLEAAGCDVGGFVLDGLTDHLGVPIKDLNELVFLSQKLIHRITHIIP